MYNVHIIAGWDTGPQLGIPQLAYGHTRAQFKALERRLNFPP